MPHSWAPINLGGPDGGVPASLLRGDYRRAPAIRGGADCRCCIIRSCSSQRAAACCQKARSSSSTACLASSRHSSICLLKNGSNARTPDLRSEKRGRLTPDRDDLPDLGSSRCPAAPQPLTTRQSNPKVNCVYARANQWRLLKLLRVLRAGHIQMRAFCL